MRHATRTTLPLLLLAAPVFFALACDGSSTQGAPGDEGTDPSSSGSDAGGNAGGDAAGGGDGSGGDASADAKVATLPTAVRQSSAVDGNQADFVRDVAVDAQGNVYVTGGTQSPNFPTTAGAYKQTYTGGGSQVGSFGDMEIFVMKFDPQGKLLWSTLLGGPNYDRAYAIEVDGAGNVYLAGRAGPGFPTTANAVNKTFGGDNNVNSGYGPQDGFAAKLSADGSQLLWSTYLNDAGRGLVRDMDIDAQGNVYAAFSNVGDMGSLITSDAVQLTLQGAADAALVKLSADGSTVLYGTYLGGNGSSLSNNPSVRVAPNGDVVVAYTDDSTNAPVTAAAYQKTRKGGNDVMVAKFTSAMKLVYLTYLGGTGDEGFETHSLAVNAAGEAIIGGGTVSTDFPTTPGTLMPTQPNGGSFFCAFITRLSADGSQLLSSSYVGGNGGASVEGIDVDQAGNIYFTGPTGASDLPVTMNAVSKTRQGSRDGFLGIITPDLKQLRFMSYFGSTGDDQIRTSILGPNGEWAFGGHAEKTAGMPLVNAHSSTITGTDPTTFHANGGFYAVLH